MKILLKYYFTLKKLSYRKVLQEDLRLAMRSHTRADLGS